MNYKYLEKDCFLEYDDFFIKTRIISLNELSIKKEDLEKRIKSIEDITEAELLDWARKNHPAFQQFSFNYELTKELEKINELIEILEKIKKEEEEKEQLVGRMLGKPTTSQAEELPGMEIKK